MGKCSTYLRGLKKGDKITGSVEVNKNFHLPKEASSLLLIGNGTGIAPFLGMIRKNSKVPIQLFWGGRTKTSLELYKPFIEESLQKNKLLCFESAFSREQQQYVQDILWTEKEFLQENINKGMVIMICGSITMQNGVLEVIENILKQGKAGTLADLELNNQLRLDCY